MFKKVEVTVYSDFCRWGQILGNIILLIHGYCEVNIKSHRRACVQNQQVGGFIYSNKFRWLDGYWFVQWNSEQLFNAKHKYFMHLYFHLSLSLSLGQPGKDSKLLPALIVARVIFVPLFMLCNVQPRSNLPIYFSHDGWFIAFMILFAFSNGYLASLCMCFGPKWVETHPPKITPHLLTLVNTEKYGNTLF